MKHLLNITHSQYDPQEFEVGSFLLLLFFLNLFFLSKNEAIPTNSLKRIETNSNRFRIDPITNIPCYLVANL